VTRFQLIYVSKIVEKTTVTIFFFNMNDLLTICWYSLPKRIWKSNNTTKT